MSSAVYSSGLEEHQQPLFLRLGISWLVSSLPVGTTVLVDPSYSVQ